jgi:hypothetical protein
LIKDESKEVDLRFESYVDCMKQTLHLDGNKGQREERRQLTKIVAERRQCINIKSNQKEKIAWLLDVVNSHLRLRLLVQDLAKEQATDYPILATPLIASSARLMQPHSKNQSIRIFVLLSDPTPFSLRAFTILVQTTRNPVERRA